MVLQAGYNMGKKFIKSLFICALLVGAGAGGGRLISKARLLLFENHIRQLCNACEKRILMDEPDGWYMAPQPVLWAHAGGGQLAVYTNSKEAIDDSIAKGYNVIEVDVALTRDGVPVLSHFFKPSGIHRPAIIPTLAEFKKERIVGKWTPLSLKECLDIYADKIWLSIDPLSIIIDSHSKDFDLIGYIENNTTLEQRKHIMYQIYTIKDLKRLKNNNSFGALHFETYFFNSFLNGGGGGSTIM